MSENDIHNYLREDLKELKQEMRESFKEVREQFDKQASVLNRNTDSLEEHIRRTDLLEDQVQFVINRLEPIDKDFQRRKAVKIYFTRKAKLVTAVVSIIGTLIGVAVSVSGLLSSK